MENNEEIATIFFGGLYDWLWILIWYIFAICVNWICFCGDFRRPWTWIQLQTKYTYWSKCDWLRCARANLEYIRTQKPYEFHVLFGNGQHIFCSFALRQSDLLSWQSGTDITVKRHFTTFFEVFTWIMQSGLFKTNSSGFNSLIACAHTHARVFGNCTRTVLISKSIYICVPASLLNLYKARFQRKPKCQELCVASQF